MPDPALLAVLLAACAGAALPATDHQLDRLRPADVPRRAGPRRPGIPGWPAVASATVVSLALVLAVTGSWLVAVAGAVVAHSAASAVVARTSSRRAAARREEALDLLGALVGELRGGAPARSALVAALGPRLPSVVAAARSPAGDPAAALNAAAGAAGYESLRDLAVAWRLAESTGASLAGPVAALATSARGDEAVRRELAAQLAGPRATALLLSALPVAGALLGSALGADPLAFLLGSPAGNGCLLAGTVLVAVGMRWTEAIVAAAERP